MNDPFEQYKYKKINAICKTSNIQLYKNKTAKAELVILQNK